MVKAWVLNDKGKKEPVAFLVDGYEPETNTVYQFHGFHWHRHTCLKNRTKRQQKSIKIRGRLIGIQNIILCQPGDEKNQYLKRCGLKRSLRLILTL